MSIREWHERWWVIPGEEVTTIGEGSAATSVEFEYDDGVVWGFQLSGSVQGRVVWDHEAEALVMSPKGLEAENAGLLRDALVQIAVPRRLSPEAQRVLDASAKALHEDQWVTGRKLRAQLQMSAEQFAPIKASLQPRLLREDRGDKGDYYSPTFPGLLRSTESGHTQRVIESVLAVLRTKFDADPDVGRYDLDEVVAQGGFGDEQRAFVDSVIVIALLLHGGGGSGSGREMRRSYGVPPDVEDLVRCHSFGDYLAFLRRGKENRAWPSAPLSLTNRRTNAVPRSAEPAETREATTQSNVDAERRSEAEQIVVDIVEPLRGSASVDMFIASAGSVGVEFEAPEYGTFWRVRCGDYLFDAGLAAGSFFIRRNGEEARTEPQDGRIDECSVLFTWGPESLRVFIRGKARGADGASSPFECSHQVRTATCIPPNRLVMWAREALLAPTKMYDTESDFRSTVLLAVSWLEDTISTTGSQRSLWDVQYSGNSVEARSPKREVECQAFFHSLLFGVGVAKNFGIYPAHSTGSGELDFLLTGTLKDYTTVRACIEFKMAHSDALEHGLVSQLPTYMRSAGCDFGIYAVLYFRCPDFDKPKVQIPELQVRLEALRGKVGLTNIRPVIINCGLPRAPSAA